MKIDLCKRIWYNIIISNERRETMDQLNKIVKVFGMLMELLFTEGLPMLAQNLLDGMRAMPCLRWTIEFIMEMNDIHCLYIARVLGALTILALGVGIVYLGRVDHRHYGLANRVVLLLCPVLSAGFGFISLVFLAAASV